MLLDSGGSGTVIRAALAKKLRKQKIEPTSWSTMAGTVSTSEMSKVQFSLPKFFDDKLVEWDVHLAKDLGNYDMIIGRDILTDLGIDIHFSTQTCTWEHSTIPMRPTSATVEQSYVVAETGPVKEATTRLKKF